MSFLPLLRHNFIFEAFCFFSLFSYTITTFLCAEVAELVDAQGSGPCGAFSHCAGSSPALGTNLRQGYGWRGHFLQGTTFYKKMMIQR